MENAIPVWEIIFLIYAIFELILAVSVSVLYESDESDDSHNYIKFGINSYLDYIKKFNICGKIIFTILIFLFLFIPYILFGICLGLFNLWLKLYKLMLKKEE